jgi:methenyltetrahydrofolate cyclohydrolase
MSAEKDYLSLPLSEFLADIAAKSPTPGGGSVAAAVGGLAASLACMVIEYTIGKPRFAEHEARLRERLSEFKSVSRAFGELMAQDMQAYTAVVAARKSEPAVRDAASLRAISVPMEIVTKAVGLLAVLEAVKSFSNPQLIGDLRASAVLVCAAAQAAGCTVRDNLGTMGDPAAANRLRVLLEDSLASAESCRDSVLQFEPGK